MNILKKFDKLNPLYSYNIFAFNGFIIILTRLYLLYYYNSCMQKYGQGSWLAAISWLMFIFGCIIFAIYTVAIIVWLFELVFKFQIKNNYFVNNKIIKVARYVCASVSLIYLIYNITALLYMFLIQPLLPSDLIYYNIHSK